MKIKHTPSLAMSVIALILLPLFIALTIHQYPSAKTGGVPSIFSFNNHTYAFTSVATTLQEQEHGLMNASVNGSTFELFVFPSPSIYPFWMKNTYSALDIVWIWNGTVTYIVNATPCISYSRNQTSCIVYTPNAFANYVIEAKSGFVNETGLKVGDKVSIK